MRFARYATSLSRTLPAVFASGFALAGLLISCGGSDQPQPPTEQPTEDSGPVDAADDSAVGTLGAPCDKPGTLACAGHAQKLQLLCDGTWKSNGVCPGNQICDSRPGPTQGSCQNPDPACVGKKPGESFCAGTVRTQCDIDLISSTSTSCPSPDHCAQGTGDKCAKCLTGKFICEGAVLKKCGADHLTYVKVETCLNEALCVDAYGKCLPPRCALGDYQCDGDTLQTCKASLLDWDIVKVCPKGMCDAKGKDCRECTPGTKECIGGETPRWCDDTGHWAIQPGCSGLTPLCKSGLCSPGFCAGGEYRCTGDILEVCNSGFTGFDTSKYCGSGLCDAAGKECDDCKSGDKGCSSSTTPHACDSAGHWKDLSPCGGTTPYCSLGLCVPCLSGLTACSGSCVDLTTSTTNCGSCGKVCPSGWSCTGGACVSTTTFAATGKGASGTIQTWTVPSTGTFTIEAYGAQGISASSSCSGGACAGGKGAKIQGDFVLSAGTVVKILVGQQGLATSCNGGGGGGSFVVTSTGTILVIAGGGGGTRTAATVNGFDASTGTSGVAGNTNPAGTGGTVVAGGTGGSGGSFSTSWGAGGGGYSGDGATDSGSGGKSFISGGAGGTGGSGGDGGFGGGGSGAGTCGGGGGGGYSGGGGGHVAGGGGSYNSGSSQVNTAGVQTGDGKVVITGK